MTSIPQLATVLQSILTTTADRAGRQTGFVQRESPVSGSVFVQTLVFGLLANPEASLSELTQTTAALGVRLSPQGLDARFTEQAALCLEQVLTAALRILVTSTPVAIPLLERFSGLYIQDSSTIMLPSSLAERWTGCGGSTPEGDAACKLQLQLDLTTGQLRGQLQDGCESDRSQSLDMLLPSEALRLADLGYWDLARMAKLEANGVFWLARGHAQTAIQTTDRRWQTLRELLENSTVSVLDIPVRLGKDISLPARLLACRVPQEVADQRRRRLRAEARDRGVTPSATTLALAGWTVFVTNLPPESLSLNEALILGRMRWQIELLFKLWKSHGEIDVVRPVKYWRQLCELYAKLLAMLVEHWIMVVGCWSVIEKSLPKAAETVRRQTLGLVMAFRTHTHLIAQLTGLIGCIAAGCRMDRRKQHPNAYQLLLDSTGDSFA